MMILAINIKLTQNLVLKGRLDFCFSFKTTHSHDDPTITKRIVDVLRPNVAGKYNVFKCFHSAA